MINEMESQDINVMRTTLNRLPPSTIKLLSSGQVITSVSTVVKELVENSIDANATNIEVKLENEGLDRIEVKDNGKGVRLDDVRYMCQKRYTSKIKEFGDLDHLNSYGFRGEALSSLCAVSDVTITTKTDSDHVAMNYTFNTEGEITSSQTSHLNKGTIVTAQGLFKNFPVRRQFLTGGKRKAQELKAVGDILKLFGLIHPNLRIVLNHNKFNIWQKNSVHSLRESLIQVVPLTVAKYLHEIDYTSDNLRIHLMIPKKDCYVWNACYGVAIDATNVFINTRPIKNKLIEKTVQDEVHQYFGNAIPQNKKPLCVVALTLPTDSVDINLEPNKTRVLIKDMENVIRALKDQLVLYYVGILEPPKPSTEENTPENHLKRKISVSSPRTKNTNKSGPVTPKKRKSDEPRESFSENNISITAEELPPTETEDNESNLNCIYEANCEINNVQVEKIKADSSQSVKDNPEELNSSFICTNEELVKVANSNESSINISVSIEQHEDKSRDENLIGVISEDDSSTDSFTEAMLNKINEDLKNYMNDDENFSLKTSSQNVTNEIVENSNVSVPDLNIEDITSSQWSRGNLMLNGDIIESSTIVANKENLTETNLNSNSSSYKRQTSDEVSLDRSISSQMGCKQLSAFTKFAREIRSNIIKQKPGITFTEVAAELASKWRNLHEDDKMIYENLAKDTKERFKKVKMPSDKPKVGIRYNPKPVKPSKKYIKTLPINLSLDNLKLALNKRVQYEAPKINIIKAIDENLTFICDNGDVTITSLDGLKEAIALYNNLNQMSIPIRLLPKRINILQSDLETDMWNILNSLETCFDDTFNTVIVINDVRIIKNGFRIEKVLDQRINKYFITDLAFEFKLFGLDELKEILEFIKSDKDVKLKDCRPAIVLNYIKDQTVMNRPFKESLTTLNITSVLDMYTFWAKNIKSTKCRHYEPVLKLLYPTN